MAEVIKFEDIKTWESKAIDAKVSELRKEFFDLKMQKAAAGVEKPHQFNTIKKNIARLLTAKNSK